MNHRRNDRYLVSLWVLPIVLGALLVVGLAAGVTRIAAGGAAAPLFGIVVGLAVVMGVRLWTKRRIELAFLQPEPEALLQLMQSGAMPIPSSAAWGAYLEAWVFTLYGRFISARAALARVAWEREPPVVQAAAMSVEALLCFFEMRDFARGAGLARAARAMADTSIALPGAKTALEGYDSLVEIGRALTNRMNADTITNLSTQARSFPFGASLIATWGLAVAYARSGDRARANETLARCAALAPHCKPLRWLPEG
jgi:hypothetical protein